MAIVGLTDNTNVWQALPEIGRIRKGSPLGERADGSPKLSKRGKKVVGDDLDYFRVDFNDGYEHLEEQFAELYGEQPKSLGPLTLLSDDIQEIAWMEAYDGNNIKVRCDGETIQKRWNRERGAYDHAKPRCEWDKKTMDECPNGCQKTARINVVLTDFLVTTGEVGYFTVITGSTADFTHLFAAMNLYMRKFTDVTRVPFMLSRVEREMTTVVPGKKEGEQSKRIRKTYNLLALKILPEYAKLMFEALPATAAALAAPASDTLPLAAGDENARLRLGGGNGGRRMDLGMVEKADKVAASVVKEADNAADHDETIDGEIVEEAEPKLDPHTIVEVRIKKNAKGKYIETELSGGLVARTTGGDVFRKIGVEPSNWTVGNKMTGLKWFGRALFEQSGKEVTLTGIEPPEDWKVAPIGKEYAE